MSTGGEMLVLCGGTSGQIHVPRLIAGWSDTNANWQQSYGASGAFYSAARAIMDSIGPADLSGINKFYLCGHSYGGACMQAMAAILRGAGTVGIKIWSYGAPRAGTFRLGTFITSATNTRFYADNDPVRFIPPHSSEVPSLTALEDWRLVQGCNQQVQAPNGWQLEADGKIVETEGNATVLHAVAFSIAAWCTDTYGFRSVNHGLANYITRFTNAYNMLTPIEIINPTRPREQPETLTVRQREHIVDQGLTDIDNTLAVMPNVNTAYVLPQVPPTSPIRFRRRKVGRVWGVKFGTEVVAIGPGKRKALKIARAYNKGAFATS